MFQFTTSWWLQTSFWVYAIDRLEQNWSTLWLSLDQEDRYRISCHLNSIWLTSGTHLFSPDCGLYSTHFIFQFFFCCSPVSLQHYNHMPDQRHRLQTKQNSVTKILSRVQIHLSAGGANNFHSILYISCILKRRWSVACCKKSTFSILCSIFPTSFAELLD